VGGVGWLLLPTCDCSISGLLANKWTFASSFSPYERCEGSNSFADRYVSHIRRPATTDHSAQFEPPNADELFESLGIVLMRIRPTFDQCATLQTERRWREEGEEEEHTTRERRGVMRREREKRDGRGVCLGGGCVRVSCFAHLKQHR